MQIFFIIGTLSYLYTEVFGGFFKKYLPYKVEAVKHPNNSTTEVIAARQEGADQETPRRAVPVRALPRQ